MVSYATPYSFTMLEIPCNPAVSSSVSFTGDMTFTIQQPGDKCFIVPKMSYISVQLQIMQTREDSSVHCLEPIINTGTRAIPTAVSVPYLCQNPAMSLFQNVSCYAGSKQISNYQNASTVNTVYRMMYETEQEQVTVNSTNGIYPMTIDDEGTAPGFAPDNFISLGAMLGVTVDNITANPPTFNTTNFGRLFTKHMLWALKNNQFNFNKSTTNRLNFQIPVSLFMTDDLLHFGVDGSCKIIFNVDPNWATNLIQIAGSNTCTIPAIGPLIPAGTNFRITTLANPTGANMGACAINVNVQDIKMYICRAHVNNTHVPRSMSLTYYTKGIVTYCTQYNNNANQLNFNAPMVTPKGRRLTHIAICFVTNPGTQFKSSPTDLSSGFTNAVPEVVNTTDMQSLIQLVSITYGGYTLPQAQYNLTYTQNNNNNVPGATPSTTNDLQKAFSDFTIFTDSFRDRVGSTLSFSKWLAQQIYVFKTRQDMNITSSDVQVVIRCITPPTVSSNVYVIGLYDEYITMRYDEFARVTDVDTDGSAPGILGPAPPPTNPFYKE